MCPHQPVRRPEFIRGKAASGAPLEEGWPPDQVRDDDWMKWGRTGINPLAIAFEVDSGRGMS